MVFISDRCKCPLRFATEGWTHAEREARESADDGLDPESCHRQRDGGEHGGSEPKGAFEDSGRPVCAMAYWETR
jgi:hypothetical protein